MMNILLVGTGGFVGAVSRFLLSDFANNLLGKWGFPIGTFTVNILGCFFYGFLSSYLEYKGILIAEVRFYLFIGFLGSFTTFSTFSFETFSLMQKGDLFMAALNIISQVVIGLGGLWIGVVIGKNFWQV